MMNVSEYELDAVLAAAQSTKNQSGQFCHVLTYARQVSKKIGTVTKSGEKRAKVWTVSDIAKEADRDPDHIPHVKNPRLPILICGRPVAELEALCEEKLLDATQSNGKSLRKDTHVLLSAVYSLPIRSEDYAENKEKCDRFAWDSLKWHAQMYGPVESAVCHLDEGFVHYHAFSIADDARGLIPGWRAKRAEIAKSLAAGMSKADANRAGNKAFKDAMIAVQDSYYEEVGSINELARYGDRRLRYAPGSGESTIKRREREEFAVRERAAREQQEKDRKKLAEHRDEQERLTALAAKNVAETQEAKKKMLAHAHQLQEIDAIANKKREDFDLMVDRLLMKPEYVREEQIKIQKIELTEAYAKIEQLEKVVMGQNSIIDKLHNIIKELKLKMNNLLAVFK